MDTNRQQQDRALTRERTNGRSIARSLRGPYIESLVHEAIDTIEMEKFISSRKTDDLMSLVPTIMERGTTVTFSGDPGTGKTHLVMSIAEYMVNEMGYEFAVNIPPEEGQEYPEGIYYIDRLSELIAFMKDRFERGIHIGVIFDDAQTYFDSRRSMSWDNRQMNSLAATCRKFHSVLAYVTHQESWIDIRSQAFARYNVHRDVLIPKPCPDDYLGCASVYYYDTLYAWTENIGECPLKFDTYAIAKFFIDCLFLDEEERIAEFAPLVKKELDDAPALMGLPAAKRYMKKNVSAVCSQTNVPDKYVGLIFKKLQYDALQITEEYE